MSNPVSLEQDAPPRCGKPNFYTLLGEQCLMVEGVMELLQHYMETPGKEMADRIEVHGEKSRHLHEEIHRHLNSVFVTPLDREDIYRASDTLGRLSRRAVTIILEMESLGLMPDAPNRMMVAAMFNGCRNLREGYALLESDPRQADPLARAASRTKRDVEKIYREGLRSLFNVEEQLQMMREHNANAEVSAMRTVIDIFKRREIYMNMNTAGSEITQAGHILHDIIIQIT